MTHHAQDSTDVEVRFSVAKLRQAQVELLLLEEEYQDGSFRDVIDLLGKIIVKLSSQRQF
jgi:hypothetical protein